MLKMKIINFFRKYLICITLIRNQWNIHFIQKIDGICKVPTTQNSERRVMICRKIFIRTKDSSWSILLENNLNPSTYDNIVVISSHESLRTYIFQRNTIPIEYVIRSKIKKYFLNEITISIKILFDSLPVSSRTTNTAPICTAFVFFICKTLRSLWHARPTPV